jgi:hypothetical protein
LPSQRLLCRARPCLPSVSGLSNLVCPCCGASVRIVRGRLVFSEEAVPASSSNADDALDPLGLHTLFPVPSPHHQSCDIGDAAAHDASASDPPPHHQICDIGDAAAHASASAKVGQNTLVETECIQKANTSAADIESELPFPTECGTPTENITCDTDMEEVPQMPHEPTASNADDALDGGLDIIPCVVAPSVSQSSASTSATP